MQRILHYEITRQLGTGKNGETMLAVDTGFERPVALKKLIKRPLSESRRESFLDEMDRLSEIDDPSIAIFYGVQDDAGVQYAVREYVEGHTVTELTRAEPMEYGKVLVLAGQLLRGLQLISNAKLVHGNISSRNVIITLDGKARLVDFGLGYGDSVPDSATTADLMYVAPEQLKGEVPDLSTDLYCLGIVFYEMLCGRPPYSAQNPEILRQSIIKGESDLQCDEVQRLPNEARLMLRTLLAPAPSDRFSSVAELLSTIEAMISYQLEQSSVIRSSGIRPSRGRQYLWIAIFAALLVILWLVISVVWR